MCFCIFFVFVADGQAAAERDITFWAPSLNYLGENGLDPGDFSTPTAMCLQLEDSEAQDNGGSPVIFSEYTPVSTTSGQCHYDDASTGASGVTLVGIGTFCLRDGDAGPTAGSCAYPESLLDSCLVGNPTLLPELIKSESAFDWISLKDPRFHISRTYRSDNLFRASDQVTLGFAGVWRANFEQFLTEDGTGNQRSYAYSDASGLRLRWNSNRTPLSDEHHFVMLSNPGASLQIASSTSITENGTTIRYFERNSTAVGVPFRHFKTTWSDGYEVTKVFNTTGLLNDVYDNRGQMYRIFWADGAENGLQNTTRSVIRRIEIDTDYDGSTFGPELALRYDFAENPVTASSSLPVLTAVTLDDLVIGGSEVQHQYGYEFGEPFQTPGLTAVWDARSGGNYQGVPFATFSYASDPLRNWPPVTSTSHNGGADQYTFLEVAPVDGEPSDVSIVQSTNALGRTTQYRFQGLGADRELTDIDGIATANCLATTTAQEYGDNNSLVVARTARNGSVTSYSYFEDPDGTHPLQRQYGPGRRGLVKTVTEDSNGVSPRVTTFEWHPAFRLPILRETSHLREEFEYDANGLIISHTQTDVLTSSPSVGESRTTTIAYETLASGLKVVSSIDGPGLSASGVFDIEVYEYNDDGTLARSTDANGLVTEYLNYTSLGQPGRVIGPDGIIYDFAYDFEGQLVSSTRDPGGDARTTSFVYDEIGQLTSTTDTNGNTWSFEYDAARRLTRTVNPLGEAMVFEHDALGNITRTEYRDGADALTFFETAQFDELGRVMQMANFENAAITISYDVEDNPIQTTDPIGSQRDNVFDALNRLAATTDELGYVTFIEHNDNDQMTRFTDPRSMETVSTYNGFGEVVTETSADRGTMSYTYDSRGLVTSMTDARGIVTTYEYDDGGRLLARRFPASPALDFTMQYDGFNSSTAAKGMLTHLYDQFGSIYNIFASNGTVFRQRRHIEGTQYQTQYSADDEGLVSSVTYPSGTRVTYSYDDANQITDVDVRRPRNPNRTFPPTISVVDGAEHLPFGPLVTLTRADGSTYVAEYDAGYRLTGQTDTAGGAAMRDIDLSYTARSNLAQKTVLAGAGGTESFQYDARAMLSGATGPYGSLLFGYDGVGNRTSLMSTPAGGTMVTDAYIFPTDSNRLIRIDEDGMPRRTFLHDAAGNVTYDDRSGTAYGYAYDAAGRMSSLSVNGVVQAEYFYNGLGQQHVRRMTQEQKTIHSIHDIEGNRIAEYEIDHLTGTTTLLREYVWMDGTVVAVIEDGAVYNVRTDHIGRPVFATDMSGLVVWQAEYLPFGGVHVSTGDTLDLRFPGQWFQSESGLHQNWMRDYDPTTGRYMQADPLGLVDGASVYGYAGQSPQVNADPTGLCWNIHSNACKGVNKARFNATLARMGQGAQAYAAGVLGYAAGVAAADGCITAEEAASIGVELLSQLRIFDPVLRMARGGKGLKGTRGGGRNDGKRTNVEIIDAQLVDARARRDALSSKRMKTPQDLDQLARINREIRRLLDQRRRSETHGRNNTRR
ncbi:RHS repeat-associated core domain-containing protein [Jannaschia pohangensis]|uniref:RHS repeat-associated core domain-containing protein n=1 Tax=Jannaschia pohangensis TaxID=390807 RepID=UPI0011133598|nr:RHS repeat-associated core domain-containing protein [Jannaschia pohangensis]